MDASYWRERWRAGQIAFHADAPNASLAAHVDVLKEAGARVLVPLCGKSIDLAFLAAHGFEVVGVELVREAAEAFFAESQLEATRSTRAGAPTLAANGIEIVIADLFALDPAALGPFDAFYDRAAVVALPQAMRPRYAAAVSAMLRPGARGLVLTVTHDADGGPPFSVTPDEIATLWPSFAITPLGTRARASGGREHPLALRQ